VVVHSEGDFRRRYQRKNKLLIEWVSDVDIVAEGILFRQA